MPEDTIHEKLTKCPNFTTFAGIINKILEFYDVCPKKINNMPEFFEIFAGKIFSGIFFGGRGGRGEQVPPAPPSPTPMPVARGY